ncbi:MAG: dienelactone hydrolase family protein [Actinomycetales bacterium]
MGKMIEIEEGLPAYLAEPRSGAVRGGLILIHEVWGLAEHTRDVADRFAAEGYVVVAPQLLADIGLDPGVGKELQDELFDPERRAAAQPKLRELMAPLHAPGFAEQTLTRVQACFAFLDSRADVAERVAVAGFCFGGSYAFSLAANEPRLKAAVPFYGHANFSDDQLKAIEAPVLAFYGQEDQGLMESLPELVEQMHGAGVDFTSVVYPGAGHAFFNDTNRWTYRPDTAKDAWEKTLTFLADNMV